MMYRSQFRQIGFFLLILFLTRNNQNVVSQDKLKPGRLPSDVRKTLRPGLLVEYRSRDGIILDSGVLRLPAILLKENEPLTPFVTERDVNIRMAGYLKLKLKGTYQFSATGNGKLEFLLNGQKLISSEGDLAEAAAAKIDLFKGYNQIEISYQPPKTGIAKLRIYWVNESFEKEPIPPTMLLFSKEANLTSVGNSDNEKSSHWDQHQNWRLGRSLVLEQNCLKCHQASNVAQLFGNRDTPNLKISSSRLNRQWLESWLLDPKKVRNEISMPRLFNSDEKQSIADLASFLTTLGPVEKMDPIAGDPDQGGDDFENVGCIGCHHFEEPNFDDEYNRVSLFYTNAKFKPGRLAEFLADSRAHYTWSRMPKFRLTQKQTADLEAFIRSASKGKTAGVGVTTPDSKNGKKIFENRGCANCHVGIIADKNEGHRHAPLFGKIRPGKGCLSASAIVDPSATPDFGLSNIERNALNQLVQDKSGESFSHVSISAFTSRNLKAMRCTTCHDLDDEQAELPYIIEEEGAVGLPPNRVPMLTFAGEKLLPKWSEKLISGNLTYRVREHFRVQMPGFPARGSIIAEGLSHLHGYERSENEKLELSKSDVEIGKKVAAMETGLSCNRCHAIADRKPNAAFDAQSTNLIYASQRLRKEYYLRWMFDPLRIDKQTKMPKFSEDRKTTSLKTVEDGDARRQFEFLWQYLNSLDQKQK